MYSNIGGKIKALAVGTFIVETVAWIFYALILAAEDPDMILLSFLMILFGPIVAWISTWLLYGFGELIDKATEIAENTLPPKEPASAPSVARTAVAKPAAPAARTADEKQARIDSLEKLREQGLITEEEYQQALTK